MKVEHEAKGKYSVPVTIIITDASAKVKGPSKPNAAYQRLDIAETDLTASKFKVHKECQKMLMRAVQPQTDTNQSDAIGNFDKLVSHINTHVMDLNHPIRIGTAVKLFLWCDTDEGSNETIKIRTQEKKRLLTLNF